MDTSIQAKFQLLIDTIQSLDIKADYDTMNKLLGCLQLLGSMKKDSEKWIIPETTKQTDEEQEVTIVDESAQ